MIKYFTSLSGKSEQLSLNMVRFKYPFLKSQICMRPQFFNARLILSAVTWEDITDTRPVTSSAYFHVLQTSIFLF